MSSSSATWTLKCQKGPHATEFLVVSMLWLSHSSELSLCEEDPNYRWVRGFVARYAHDITDTAKESYQSTQPCSSQCLLEQAKGKWGVVTPWLFWKQQLMITREPMVAVIAVIWTNYAWIESLCSSHFWTADIISKKKRKKLTVACVEVI